MSKGISDLDQAINQHVKNEVRRQIAQLDLPTRVQIHNMLLRERYQGPRVDRATESPRHIAVETLKEIAKSGRPAERLHAAQTLLMLSE